MAQQPNPFASATFTITIVDNTLYIINIGCSGLEYGLTTTGFSHTTIPKDKLIRRKNLSLLEI